MSTFRASHREFQELVREHSLLRRHNRAFKDGETQDSLLLFAEAALVLVVLERFLRMILGPAGDEQTLHNLLEQATGARHRLLVLPGSDRDDAIRRITGVRNTLLHGNYEQAARESGCASVSEYFRTTFAAEVEALYEIANRLVAQIDPDTGRPHDEGPTP